MRADVKDEVVSLRDHQVALGTAMVLRPRGSWPLKGQVLHLLFIILFFNCVVLLPTMQKNEKKEKNTNLDIISFQLKSILLAAVVTQQSTLPLSVEVLQDQILLLDHDQQFTDLVTQKADHQLFQWEGRFISIFLFSSFVAFSHLNSDRLDPVRGLCFRIGWA